jgi:hypothetical protein
MVVGVGKATEVKKNSQRTLGFFLSKVPLWASY